MMFFYGSAWPAWAAALMWVASIAFWVLLFAAIYVLISRAARGTNPAPGDDPRGILDQRLARGEITPEQYRQLCATLETGGRAAVGSGA